jgi:hypothetical protein
VEFADVLRRRKMVRNYTEERVEREVIERIVAKEALRRRRRPLEEVVRWERW